MSLNTRVLTKNLAACNRRGLTLMELLVVLTILVAVASIMVPMFPNFLRRAHKATDCTQTSEVAKAIQVYQASTYSYPDNLDSLTDTTGAFPAYLPGGATAPFGGFVTASQLTSDEVDALGRVGIKNVQQLLSTTTQPTLMPYPTTGGSVALSTSVNVAVLNTQGATPVNYSNVAWLVADIARETALIGTSTTIPQPKYIVFGVGSRNTMIGQTIQDAPISVPQDRDVTPDNSYCRVGVVFKVDGYEVTKTERARFMGAVALEDDELETTEKDIIGYYNVANAGS